MGKKLSILLVCAVSALVFSSCNSVGPGRKPIDLTEKQKNDLIDYVRFMIIRNRHMVNPKEKELIKVMPPMFRYSVDSNGYDIVRYQLETKCQQDYQSHWRRHSLHPEYGLARRNYQQSRKRLQGQSYCQEVRFAKR